MMHNISQIVSAMVVLAALPVVSTDDWRGFRGMEKEGRCDSVVGPLTWSPSYNVAWKTVIPGRGHSSPIVSENAVYVATAYERDASSVVQNVLNYVLSLLTLVITTAGVRVSLSGLSSRPRKLEQAWQHLRFFLFIQLLGAVTIIVLWGRHLFNPDDDTIRLWLISLAMVLSCLVLASLFVPLCVRQHLLTGLFALAATGVSVWILRRKAGVFPGTGTTGLVLTALVILPALFGLVLSVAHLVSRRRLSETQNSKDVAPERLVRRPFVVTGSVALVAALAPFLLVLFRAADYQIPDSYILDTRVKPDLGWGWAGAYLVLLLLGMAGGRAKFVRDRMAARFSLQPMFLATALILATLFLMRAGSGVRPQESVRAILCVDAKTGDIRWTCEGLVGRKRAESQMVTGASPTLVTEDERIYGYFGEDGLLCVSTTGQLLWKKAEPVFRGQFGVGTSPVVKDKILIVVSDTRESAKFPAFIAACDGISGQCLWKKERKCHTVDAAYGTPLLRSLGGRPVVLVQGWYDVKGYDLATGQELWSYPLAHEAKHLVASLVSTKDRLYVTGAKQTVALDLSKVGSGGDPTLWSTPIAGEKSATPVLANGLLFLVTEVGVAFCLDAQTGEVLWKKRLGGRYFSSVLALGDRVLFTSEAGQTTIVAADKEFQLLAKNSLGEPIYASFVPMGNRLLVRTTKHIYCLAEEEQR